MKSFLVTYYQQNAQDGGRDTYKMVSGSSAEKVLEKTIKDLDEWLSFFPKGSWVSPMYSNVKVYEISQGPICQFIGEKRNE